MRIIAGKLKGRRLTAPKGDKIRPTTDKVKEALFSMGDSYGGFQDTVVCDLFAGTGNLGLEAVSRGARMVYFGDVSRESIALVRANVEYCKGASDFSRIYLGDFNRVLGKVKDEEGGCDIVFIDPPYHLNLQKEVVEKISELDLLNENGVIFVEHPKTLRLEEKIGKYSKLKEKKYGIIIVTVYGFAEEGEEIN